MNAPKHCKHKPIVSVNNYHQNDGPYGPKTDAKALSLGWAQYDKKDLSLKVWRRVHNKWSRQSEELPLHRNLDLTILLLEVLFGNHDNSDSSLGLEKSHVTINRPEDIQRIRDYYDTHKDILEPRLREIKHLLETL